MKRFRRKSTTGTASTINRPHEKLLLLKYRMNTLTAKNAAERHEFLEFFLRNFIMSGILPWVKICNCLCPSCIMSHL